MNEEEKEAIARVERLYKFSQDVNHTAIVLTEDTRCLGIVLNLLQQEKEKNKKLEEEKEAFARSYVQASDNEVAAVIRSVNQKNFYEKVISLIAIDYMNNHISGEYSDTPCEYYEEIEKKEKCQGKMWDDVCFGDCKECLIQYYFNKARGESE